jgi:hypothetical protein
VGTASCARPWPGATSGPTLPNRDRSSGPARRAAGVGCVSVATGPMETAWRQGVTRRRHPEGRTSSGPSTPKQIAACIQRQVQAPRALRSAPVLPCSGCPREGRRAFEEPIPTAFALEDRDVVAGALSLFEAGSCG